MNSTKLLTLIVLAATWWASASQALTLEIHSIKNTITTFDVPTPKPNSDVGVVTVEALKQHNIPFEGSPTGISSIYSLGSNLDVISDNKMKAWGWCFALDGQVGDKMPDQVQIHEKIKVLKWFYAYALYDSGTWTGYCIEDK